MSRPQPCRNRSRSLSRHAETSLAPRAVDQDSDIKIAALLEPERNLPRPGFHHIRNFRLRLCAAEHGDAKLLGIIEIWECVAADMPEPIRADRTRLFPHRQQQRSRLRPLNGLTVAAIETGGGDNLAGFAAGATIQLRDQIAHRLRAASQQQFVKLCRVVPVCRRAALIGFADASYFSGVMDPGEGLRVIRQRWPKTDFDAGADWLVGFLDADDLVVPSNFGRNVMRRLRVMTTSVPSDASTAPATTRRPLPSWPRCGRRKSLLERSGRPML